MEKKYVNKIKDSNNEYIIQDAELSEVVNDAIEAIENVANELVEIESNIETVDKKVDDIKQINLRPSLTMFRKHYRLYDTTTIEPSKCYNKLQGNCYIEKFDMWVSAWDNFGNDSASGEYNNNTMLTATNSSGVVASYEELAEGGHCNSICFDEATNILYIVQLYQLLSDGTYFKTTKVLKYGFNGSSFSKLQSIELDFLRDDFLSYGFTNFNLNSLEYDNTSKKFYAYVSNDSREGYIYYLGYSDEFSKNPSTILDFKSLNYVGFGEMYHSLYKQTFKKIDSNTFGLLQFKPNIMYLYDIEDLKLINIIDLGNYGNSSYFIGEPQDFTGIGGKVYLGSSFYSNSYDQESTAWLSVFDIYRGTPSASTDNAKSSEYGHTLYVDNSTTNDFKPEDGSVNYPFSTTTSAINYINNPLNAIDSCTLVYQQSNRGVYPCGYVKTEKSVILQCENSSTYLSKIVSQNCSFVRIDGLQFKYSNQYMKKDSSLISVINVYTTDVLILNCEFDVNVSGYVPERDIALFQSTGRIVNNVISNDVTDCCIRFSSQSQGTVSRLTSNNASDKLVDVIAESVGFIDSDIRGRLGLGSTSSVIYFETGATAYLPDIS